MAKNQRARLRQKILELRKELDDTDDVAARADKMRAIELIDTLLAPGAPGRPREWSRQRLLQLELDYLLEWLGNRKASAVEICKALCKLERYQGIHWETLRRRKPRAGRRGRVPSHIRLKGKPRRRPANLLVMSSGLLAWITPRTKAVEAQD